LAGLPESEKYARLLAALDRTVLDPSKWNDVCDALASILDATGALLISRDEDERGLGQPHSSSLDEMFQNYISAGWHKRDFRAAGFPKAISAGFVTDQDLIAPEEMLRHPYYTDLVLPAGLQWFVGTTVEINRKVWGIAVHGTPQRGPFFSGDIEKLMRVRGDIALGAKRVAALGFQRVESLEKTLAAAGRGVVALDWSGKIRSMNERAEALLREAELVSDRRLRSLDPDLDNKLLTLVASAVEYRGKIIFAPSPLLVPLGSKRLISIDAVPMPREFRSFLDGTSALVTLHEVVPHPAGLASLRTRFQLTGRETELTSHITSGRTTAASAEIMGISVSTARQYLKSILAKTGTHRQAELVALLARLRGDS
jgi:DNA-binding CsgD family transcriptional regulator